jgi:ferredoxin
VGFEIQIDREKCIGSGNCGFFAPATFDIDDDLKAFLLETAATPDGDSEEQVLLAADGCPTTAITVLRDGLVIFPEGPIPPTGSTGSAGDLDGGSA